MAGMLSSASFDPEADAQALSAPPKPEQPDPARAMYHDYLTNPNSTYGQDPTLSGKLKSAVAPGITPGSLTGTPDEVAKQGLTPTVYNSVFGASTAQPDPLKEATGDQRFGMMSWGGQDVMTGSAIKDSILAGAKQAGMDPMAYDKMLNPKTYGARWGIADPATPTTPGTPAAPAAPGDVITLPSMTGVAGYKPAQTDVAPGMLAAGNLASIMDPNSPLMVQAATQGNQAANRRGLQNSSIGISAAQDSMLRAATPLALQDANTQANVALANTGAKNTAGQFNAGAQNTSTLTNQQLASQQLIAQQQLASQQKIAQLNADTSVLTAKLSTDAQAALAGVNNQHQKLIQSNSQAATAMNNYAATVANIQASKDMDGTAKQKAVDAQLTMLRNTLAALESQSGQNLEKFFPMIISETPADQGGGNGKNEEYNWMPP